VFQFWGIVFIVSFSVIILLSMGYYEFLSFKTRSEQLRNNYISQQEELIKSQVENVVDRINDKKKIVENSKR